MASERCTFRIIPLLLCLVAVAGCGELRARYTVQRADELYYAAKFREAAAKYETALSFHEDLPIGHHNAALAYFRSFRPGDQSPENLAFADKAAEHFRKYLESEPNDRQIRLFLTRIWVDSGKYDKAIAFWEQELAGDKNNVEIMSALSEINRQSGNFAKSLEWMDRRVEAESTPEGKVTALVAIGHIQYSRLATKDLMDVERLTVADEGIAALLRASEIAPENKMVHATLASLYKKRSLAHGAAWASAADQTSQFFHNGRFGEISKKERGEQPTPTPPPTEGATPPAEGAPPPATPEAATPPAEGTAPEAPKGEAP